MIQGFSSEGKCTGGSLGLRSRPRTAVQLPRGLSTDRVDPQVVRNAVAPWGMLTVLTIHVGLTPSFRYKVANAGAGGQRHADVMTETLSESLSRRIMVRYIQHKRVIRMQFSTQNDYDYVKSFDRIDDILTSANSNYSASA